MDDILQTIFCNTFSFNENDYIPIKVSLKFVSTNIYVSFVVTNIWISVWKSFLVDYTMGNMLHLVTGSVKLLVMSPMAVITDILTRIAVKSRIRMRETHFWHWKQENCHNFLVTDQFYFYSSGLVQWHQNKLTAALLPVKQPWKIWVKYHTDSRWTDLTTSKQSTTKLCAYFMRYTLFEIWASPQYNDRLSGYWDFQVKDKTVAWPSYL